MADPYQLPEARRKPPALTLMSIIGVLFLLFTLYQVNATIDETSRELEQLSLQAGDRIEYHYTARLPDGRIYQTTRLAVAQEAAESSDYTLQPPGAYTPQRATLNPNEPGLGWGAEAEGTVLQHRVGQTVHLMVPAAEGVGDWAPFSPDGFPRELLPQPFSRLVFFQEPAAAAAEGNTGNPGFNLTELNNTIGPIHSGFVYDASRDFPPAWPLEFIDVNFENRSLLYRHMVDHGDSFDVPQLPGGVTILLQDNESTLVYRLDVEEGRTFVVEEGSPLTLGGRGFPVGSYLVQGVEAETIDLLYHNSLDPAAVGQPLDVELEILRKIEA